MRLWIILLILAAAFSGLDQIIRLGWEYRSWFPEWFFSWDTGWGKFDAWHTWQGMVYFLLLAGGIFLSGELDKVSYKGGIFVVLFFVTVFLLWFQIRNLFLHIIWLKPEYWQFPFRQVFL